MKAYDLTKLTAEQKPCTVLLQGSLFEITQCGTQSIGGISQLRKLLIINPDPDPDPEAPYQMLQVETFKNDRI